MIRVSVLYPNQPGKKFDWTYYTGKHIPLLKQRLSSKGLVRVELDKGISAPDPKAPPEFIAAEYLTFNTVDEVHEGFKAVGREVMGDIKNYTDVQPRIQISEVVG
ncbi:MAG TPA: EthD family reductase [Dehalococcoidia bacterium]|nr:EthD family reductase [Dehalococcoidia bacterium]